MANAYTPTDFYSKDGQTKRTAKTWSAHWQYIFEGWHPGGPAPAPPRNLIGATLADIDTELASYTGFGDDLSGFVAALPGGAEYVYNLTDGAGTLLDIVSGVTA